MSKGFCRLDGVPCSDLWPSPRSQSWDHQSPSRCHELEDSLDRTANLHPRQLDSLSLHTPSDRGVVIAVHLASCIRHQNYAPVVQQLLAVLDDHLYGYYDGRYSFSCQRVRPDWPRLPSPSFVSLGLILPTRSLIW